MEQETPHLHPHLKGITAVAVYTLVSQAPHLVVVVAHQQLEQAPQMTACRVPEEMGRYLLFQDRLSLTLAVAAVATIVQADNQPALAVTGVAALAALMAQLDQTARLILAAAAVAVDFCHRHQLMAPAAQAVQAS